MISLKFPIHLAADSPLAPPKTQCHKSLLYLQKHDMQNYTQVKHTF